MFRICEGEAGKRMRKTARLRGDGTERARFDAKRGNAAKKARQRGMWAPFGIPQRLTLEMKLPWHYRVGARPPDASLTCGWVRKNGEADTELPPLRGESAVERARSDVGYHIFRWNCSTKRKLFLKSVQNPGFSAKLRKKRRTSLHNNINQGKIDAAGRDCKTLS